MSEAPALVTPSVSAQLAQIERDAREGKQPAQETILWLVSELRARTAELVSIDARVRDLCGQIDGVLGKTIAP